MKLVLVTLAALTALVAAVSARAHRESAALKQLPPAAGAGELVYYGHIRSIARKGSRFEVRFDPAWLLEGATAERAAVADKVVPPGQPVPNDNYTRDESHETVVFFAAPSARGTLLTKGLGTVTVPIGELAEVVRGRNPKHRPLFSLGTASGFWLRVRVDKVRSFDQQYHP